MYWARPINAARSLLLSYSQPPVSYPRSVETNIITVRIHELDISSILYILYIGNKCEKRKSIRHGLISRHDTILKKVTVSKSFPAL